MAPATEEEFRQWAESARAGLRRTAFLLCGDWSAADDLVQDAMVKVFLRWRGIRSNPTAYAHKAVSTCFIDSTRRPWRRETAVDDLPESGSDGPDSTTRHLLLAALANVPPGQRTVLVLRYWEDMSMAEVAAALGCSVGTAKSQAARGLERLRAELAAIGGTTELGFEVQT